MTLTDSQGEIPFVDLKLQHELLKDELLAAIIESTSTADFILGTQVADFEREFAEFNQVRHSIGVANGLDALRLSLAALGVGDGDEVILPANTFIATALAVSAVGAHPVLVDCDPDSYQISVDAVANALSAKTKAIMPVHLMGTPCDMPALMSLANEHRLRVVEDACQAHGALVHGKPCGTFGDAGCFSFYPAKNLGALGDGGAVVTNRDDVADAVRVARHYGQRQKNHHEVQGLNSRLDNLQASILRIKLRRLSQWNELRRKHAARYRALLEGIGDLKFPSCLPNSVPVYHLFVIETAHRDSLQRHLQDHGVQTGIHYPVPVHLQPAYRDLGHSHGDFPVAESLAKRMLSLPMYPELETGQIDRVVECIRAAFKSGVK